MPKTINSGNDEQETRYDIFFLSTQHTYTHVSFLFYSRSFSLLFFLLASVSTIKLYKGVCITCKVIHCLKNEVHTTHDTQHITQYQYNKHTSIEFSKCLPHHTILYTTFQPFPFRHSSPSFSITLFNLFCIRKERKREKERRRGERGQCCGPTGNQKVKNNKK
jgi:hypothetical protein